MFAVVDTGDGCRFAVGRMFEVEEEVGAETVYPFLGDDFAGLVLVLENDNRCVDGTRVQFRARRDGVVPGLETRDSRYDDVEGNRPLGSVLRGRQLLDIVAGSELEDFAKL